MLNENFMRSEFYEADPSGPEQVVLTMFVNGKPLAHLKFNKPQLSELIDRLQEMKSKFHD